MFFRGVPLYGYFILVSYILLAVVKCSILNKMVWFFTGQAPVYLPIWLLNDPLHSYLCIVYCPLWIILRLTFQSVLWRRNIKLIGTRMVSRHQAPCLSGVSPLTVIYYLYTYLCMFYRSLWIMFIRGFSLYGYLMTVSTPTSANFITRCELFCFE